MNMDFKCMQHMCDYLNKVMNKILNSIKIFEDFVIL